MCVVCVGNRILTVAVNMNTRYYIISHRFESPPTYWNLDLGWIEDFHLATRFPRDILSVPLPPGSGGVMLINETGDLLVFYEAVTPTHGGDPFKFGENF